MLTPYWTTFTKHVPEQQRLLRCHKPWRCIAAGRGSGKTEIARRYLVMSLLQKKPWPDPKYFYILPTSAMASRIAWTPIKKLIPDSFIESKNETRMELTTIFGSKLFVGSGEVPSRWEGVQWAGGIIDEASDQKPTLFKLSLLPGLSHGQAWLWMIGVPKRVGVGAQLFKEVFEEGYNSEKIGSFTWKSSEVLLPDQLEHYKKILSPSDYREQFEASWENATGLVFSEFSEANISHDAVYHPSRIIYVGSDFNVDPMAWTLSHFINGKLYFFDEIYLRNVNTTSTLKYLHQKYPDHAAGWIFTGDATSASRKTSASVSDYLQIVNSQLFKDKMVKFPRSNPPVADRVAAANAALCNANNERRLFVNPSCQYLIRDFKYRAYEASSNRILDAPDIGHISDAATYVTWQLIPLTIHSNLSTPTAPILVD